DDVEAPRVSAARLPFAGQIGTEKAARVGTVAAGTAVLEHRAAVGDRQGVAFEWILLGPRRLRLNERKDQENQYRHGVFFFPLAAGAPPPPRVSPLPRPAV